MTQIKETDLAVYKSEATDLEKLASEYQIATADENAQAMEFKAKIKAALKSVTAKKEEATKPLNATLKAIRGWFAPIETQLEKADTIMAKKLITYKRKVEDEARAKEAAIAKKVEAGRMRLDTAEKKLEQVNETKVATTNATAAGNVQFRKIKKVRFANTALLTSEQITNLARSGYFVWDEVKARKDALAGIQIPGVEVYEEEIV